MLVWNDNTFCIGDTRFRVGLRAKAEPGEFWMPNPRALVDQYVHLISELEPQLILELGIYQGASVAFLSLVARPRKCVAIDIHPYGPKRLLQWIRDLDLDETVSLFFGVDQADRKRLRRIVESEFGTQPLDLVIDDASHRLAPTRASFNTLFPYLRPGGVYVIEDWAASHQIEHAMLADPAIRETLRDQATVEPQLTEESAPLTHLLFETVLAAAYGDAIADIHVQRDWLAITRGSAELPRDGFDISTSYEPLGRSLLTPLTRSAHAR